MRTNPLYRRRFLIKSSIFLGFCAIPCKKVWGSVPKVNSARIGEQTNNTTRFVMDVSKTVDFKIFMLKNPDRVVVDFPYMEWDLTKENGKGLIKSFRFARFNQNTSRLVLDLTNSVKIDDAIILPSSIGESARFVLDLKPENTPNVLDDKNKNKQVYNSNIPSKKPTQTSVKKIITLDPGHGGIDPGAIGSGGIYEKNITLSAAKQAKKLLEQTGKYRVYLTRSSDKFLKLHERVNFARNKKSDLFISIHADCLQDKSVSGASIYTLAEKASDARTAELVARENKVELNKKGASVKIRLK